MRNAFFRSTYLIPGLALIALSAVAQDPAASTASEAAVASGPSLVPLLSRWLHVLSAIFLLGGALYLRTVLMPAASAVLDDENHQKLKGGLIKRWGKFVHVLVTLLLLTGLYNFYNIVITQKAHDGEPVYHMLFGIKFLLAIAVFGLAIMLAGRRSVSQKLQQNSGLWLGITIAMGVAIVLIAGYMKMM